ncbi:MAG TPA: HD domain-containing phosphohydrolase, partial [Blastocatellia bacterium]|nr:HD domain-containing phosphohydrolase [Blastocatellia bacterium]
DMLAFEDIPIGARILRAVELYSALVSDRPYRAALNREQAIETLKASAGIECDPYIVKALVALLEDINAQTEAAEPAPITETPRPVTGAPASGMSNMPLSEPPDAWSSAAEPRSQSVEAAHTAVDQSQPDKAPSSPDAGVSSARPYGGEFSDRPYSAIESSLAAQSTEAAPAEPIQETVKSHATGEPQTGVSETHAPDAHTSETHTSDTHVSDTRASDVSYPPRFESPAPQSMTRHAAMDAAARTAPVFGANKARARVKDFAEAEPPPWHQWVSSRYNKKSLLGYEASVLRQIEFRSVAIPFTNLSRLDWYLKAWGKVIFANDPRAWAGTAARAMVEAREPLSEDHIMRVLEDVYVPGAKLMNTELRRWFGETDAWWMDNLRRNIDALEDETIRAQAMVLGMKTGDYALSFQEQTRDLRRPLTTIFWRLAGRAFIGPAGHPNNRGNNMPAEEFLKRVRADLLYLSLPTAHTEQAGAEARSEWRESWVRAAAGGGAEDMTRLMTAPQSKQSYLALIDRLLRSASHMKTWAIGYQEIGLASASDIAELIKEYRPVRATYSKDLTEVAGGLRSFIIIAERVNA